jgi:hypothetical protein
MNKPDYQTHKPYSKPALITYGTIRDLTKSITNNGASDNALPTAKRHKTALT